MNTIERIGYLKKQIDEQREWGNNKVADIFAKELDELLRRLNLELDISIKMAREFKA